ncbi:MAG TPA: IMP dehydrogenase [Actinomycetota bacterium]|nr:IMP dehydrogenase [Actinomycetota bacterium]
MRIVDEISRSLDEYLLLPNLTTEDCSPSTADLRSPLVRHRVGEEPPITLAVPLTSAIMQAVSSPRLAIALAQCGGFGFIHHDQPVAAQAAMVSSVKRHKAGFRYSEVNVKPNATLGELKRLLDDADVDIAMVTDDGSPHGIFLGTISRHDFHPSRHSLDQSVDSRMRPSSELVTAPPTVSLSEANSLIWDHRTDVLPIVDEQGQLESIVLRHDYELHKRFRDETIDGDKRFRVGAGINTHDYRDRVPELLEAGADVLCVDSSDGYSVWQRKTLEYVKEELGSPVPVGGGNVVDGRAFRYLAEAGADFVKVGIGGGSICITRDQKGIGRGQASALIDVVRERDAYAAETGTYVPVCCDGGLLNDYHMAIAFALGADFMMLGRYFARFEESPSALVRVNGQLYKEYWGEGSQRARNWARYEQGDEEALVFEEGVDGYVPYAGSLYDGVAATLAKLRATMSSCGARTLREFHENAVLVPVSQRTFVQNTHEVQLFDRPQGQQ